MKLHKRKLYIYTGRVLNCNVTRYIIANSRKEADLVHKKNYVLPMKVDGVDIKPVFIQVNSIAQKPIKNEVTHLNKYRITFAKGDVTLEATSHEQARRKFILRHGDYEIDLITQLTFNT